MKESFLTTTVLDKSVKNELSDYPTSSNLTYAWGFGSLAGLCLVIQLVTGIFLAMHYTPEQSLAFDSVEHIMRDVNYGWLLRYAHSNGASMFFIVVYLHIGRGLYYGSYLYPRRLLWLSGILLFLLMMGTGFIGYVLPWGQMSFWGATVITNLVTVIPYGDSIVFWIWGGYSVDNATLNRFFSLHYLLPFIIAALSGLHLLLLHLEGSSNPLSIDNNIYIQFYPYFYVKDLFFFFLFLIFFSYFVFFIPNYLGHPDNYIRANPMVTPPHIVPEWYFLPFYAILRSIPNKFLGVVAMITAILVLATLSFNNVNIKSGQFRARYKFYYWCFVFNFFLLGWLGSQPVEYPFVDLGQMASKIHFFYFLFFIPYSNLWDSNSNHKWFPFNLINYVGVKIINGFKHVSLVISNINNSMSFLTENYDTFEEPKRPFWYKTERFFCRYFTMISIDYATFDRWAEEDMKKKNIVVENKEESMEDNNIVENEEGFNLEDFAKFAFIQKFEFLSNFFSNFDSFFFNQK